MIATLNILCAIENTVLNFVLIPHWGIMGAALSTLVSAACLFAGYMILSQRTYYVPHHWQSLGTSVLVVSGLLFLGAQLPSVSFLGILVKVSLVGCAVIGFLVTGLVQREEIKVAFSQIQNLISSRVHP
jgi:O-antigen/teichoic acid export membrane protein